jgi:transcription initiation factor TFIIH subunit 3
MKFTTSDGGKHLSARILILSIDSDSPSQYISIMNSIFSAQKSSVTVDVCRLVISNTNTTEDSIFQQQAAFITGGIYLKLKDLSQLPQYLMVRRIEGIASRYQNMK